MENIEKGSILFEKHRTFFEKDFIIDFRITANSTVYMGRSKTDPRLKVVIKVINHSEYIALDFVRKNCSQILPRIIEMGFNSVVGIGKFITEMCKYDLETAIKYNHSHDIKKFIKVLIQYISILHNFGWAHRDLKPKNILVCCNDVKLIDFENSTAEKLKKDLVGTADFVAPEVIKSIINRIPYDVYKADVWSLGVTFCYLYTKKLPWEFSFNKPGAEQRIKMFSMQNYFKEYPDKEILYYLATLEQVNIPTTLDIKVADLLSRMLNIDPEKRPTIDEISRHIYFLDI